uniref:Serine aminopeptidase S33 domain-containing protein n=2 Tax=Parascaris univalens TaxID=6257 RepID=A0A915A670_PARUN
MGPQQEKNSRQSLSPSSSTRQNRAKGGKQLKSKKDIEEPSRTGWTDESDDGRKNNPKDGYLRVCAAQRTSKGADEYAKVEQKLASVSASRMPLLPKSVTVIDFADVPTAREITHAGASPRRRQHRSDMPSRSLRSLGSSLRASLESFSTRLTPHEAKCRRHNRHRRRMVERSERIEKQKLEDDEAFLSIIEEYKQKRHILECVCERRRCSCVSMFCSSICRILRFTRQLIYCCCLPPLLSRCVSKGAFWPPPREYYFFINSNKSTKGAEAAQRAEIKVRKADGKCLRRRDWRFGFEHPCAEEVTDVECFIVRTKRNNHIAGVFVRRSRPLYTLLFSHPNATDISDHLIGIPNLFDAARYLNCNVCAYDYSGYGISEGTPTEENLYADIGAVYEHLVRERSILPPDIILWGYSIGASASVELAAKTNDVAGLVLLSPPVSFLRTLCWCKSCRKTTCCRSSSPCPCDRFASIRKVDKIRAPTLILHGMLDSMVSLDHVQALYNRCPAAVEPLWIPDVGHNNMGNSAMLWKRIRKFLNE